MSGTSDHDLLIRIDERTETILKQQEALTKEQAAHGTRIGNLEGESNRLKGLVAAISAGVGFTASWLSRKLFG
jgi:hypothetical protein